MTDRLYFRQLLAGVDFARLQPQAAQMVNFVYLIGDSVTRECMVVDAAWDVRSLVRIAEEDGMKLTGALATHWHPDHVGGDLFGTPVEGLASLLELQGMKAHVHREEAPWVKQMTGLSDSDLALHEGGDKVEVGEIRIEIVHTPGHTPGSQCFLVEGRLVSGDTLFVGGCGRVDLPGSDPDEMFRSLTQRIGALPGATILYPGHNYGASRTATLEEERRSNYYLKVPDLATWKSLMG